MRIVAAAKVAAPTAGPAREGAFAGTSSSRATAMGMAATAITMNATPDTTGVMTRRSLASQKDKANWTRDAAITRLDITGNPPSVTARTQTGRNGEPEPISIMYPGPRRPALMAWWAVASPPIRRDAKTAHER